MKLGKVEKTLSIRENYNGRIMTRAEFVEEMTNKGNKVYFGTPGYSFEDKERDGVRVEITKTEADYAAFLGAPMPTAEEYERAERSALLDKIGERTDIVYTNEWQAYSEKYIERHNDSWAKIYERYNHLCNKLRRA